MNIYLLWFLFALVNFMLIVGVYKLFGKTGLFAWIALGTILANIQVMKSIEFDLSWFKSGFIAYATLGNIMYGTLFLVTDALGEKYGLKDAKKAVYLGFFSLIAMVVIMQMALLFEPSEFDIAQDSLKVIFDFVPRVALGSLVAYIISQLLDVHLFQRIKKKFPSDKYLWLRNNGSTVVSQFIDTLIFVPIAFIGAEGFPMEIIDDIFITTYLIKVVVAFLDTPFVYLMKRITPLSE